MDAKVGHFPSKSSRLFAVAYDYVGNSSLGVKTPSSSGNVYFANGQTDIILLIVESVTL
jgi:hypothetical protein